MKKIVKQVVGFLFLILSVAFANDTEPRRFSSLVILINFKYFSLAIGYF
jgi:hypothetical protein